MSHPNSTQKARLVQLVDRAHELYETDKQYRNSHLGQSPLITFKATKDIRLVLKAIGDEFDQLAPFFGAHFWFYLACLTDDYDRVYQDFVAWVKAQ